MFRCWCYVFKFDSLGLCRRRQSQISYSHDQNRWPITVCGFSQAINVASREFTAESCSGTSLAKVCKIKQVMATGYSENLHFTWFSMAKQQVAREDAQSNSNHDVKSRMIRLQRMGRFQARRQRMEAQPRGKIIARIMMLIERGAKGWVMKWTEVSREKCRDHVMRRGRSFNSLVFHLVQTSTVIPLWRAGSPLLLFTFTADCLNLLLSMWGGLWWDLCSKQFYLGTGVWRQSRRQLFPFWKLESITNRCKYLVIGITVTNEASNVTWVTKLLYIKWYA